MNIHSYIMSIVLLLGIIPASMHAGSCGGAFGGAVLGTMVGTAISQPRTPYYVERTQIVDRPVYVERQSLKPVRSRYDEDEDYFERRKKRENNEVKLQELKTREQEAKTAEANAQATKAKAEAEKVKAELELAKLKASKKNISGTPETKTSSWFS